MKCAIGSFAIAISLLITPALAKAEYGALRQQVICKLDSPYSHPEFGATIGYIAVTGQVSDYYCSAGDGCVRDVDDGRAGTIALLGPDKDTVALIQMNGRAYQRLYPVFGRSSSFRIKAGRGFDSPIALAITAERIDDRKEDWLKTGLRTKIAARCIFGDGPKANEL